MSRIDLAIKLTSAGAREPVTTSNGPWVSYIRDVRDVFQYLSGFDGKVITLMSFCQTGCLVTLVRSIPGRAGDNVAAWMHIPSNCAVTGEELSRLMIELKGVLRNSSISLADLQALASRNYPDKPVNLDYTPSVREGAYAFRKTDFYSVTEILGNGRYQEYYTPYKGIIILDASDTVAPAVSMKDLTRMSIESTCVLIPPTQAEVEALLGPDVSLVYQTPTGFVPFKDPIKMKKGSSVTLHAFKQGYDKIPFLIQVNEEFQKCGLPAGFNPVWKRTFTRSNFKILDQSNGNEPIQSARISVNGVELTTGVISLTESEIKTARVKVSASGYEPYEGDMRVYNFDTVVVYLTRTYFGNQYRIMSKDNRTAFDITIPPGVDKSKSPLEGYVWGRGGNTLYYDDKAESKTFWLGAACGLGAALVVGLLAWGIPALVGLIGKDKEYTPSGPPQTVERPHIDNPSIQDPVVDFKDPFVAYMDNNEVWEKDDLEQYCPGLFDAMDTYNYNRIRDLLAPYGEDSVRARQLLDALQDAKTKTGNYCEKGVDFKITVSNYISKIKPSPKSTQAPPQSNGGHTSRSGSTGGGNSVGSGSRGSSGGSQSSSSSSGTSSSGSGSSKHDDE